MPASRTYSAMIPALIKTIPNLMTGYVLRYMIMSGGLALVALMVFMVSGYHIVSAFTDGEGWISSVFSSAGGFAGAVLGYFLFPTITVFISSFFIDAVANRVEKSDYPHVKTEVSDRLPHLIKDGLAFFVKSMLINIIAIPLYFIPVIQLFAYYIINGYLFGQEYANMITPRYVGRAERKTLIKQRRRLLFMCGVMIAVGFTIPLVNLVMPIIAGIFMVHVYHLSLK